MSQQSILVDDDGNFWLADLGLAGLMADSGEPVRAADARPTTAPAADDRTRFAQIVRQLTKRGEWPQAHDILVSLDVLLDDLPPNRQDSVPSMSDVHRSIANLVGRPSEISAATGGFARDETADHNPFRGLREFDESDGPLFFGRSKAVETVIELMNNHPMVAVVGPSGAGKSSLVKAGVLPALRSGVLQGTTPFIATMVPGSLPTARLLAALDAIATRSIGGLGVP